MSRLYGVSESVQLLQSEKQNTSGMYAAQRFEREEKTGEEKTKDK
jgi:hypothetical protein